MTQTKHLSEIRARYANGNVTPVWLLIFWRLVRGEARGDFAKAYRMLPGHIPAGSKSPSVEECAAIIAYHKLA